MDSIAHLRPQSHTQYGHLESSGNCGLSDFDEGHGPNLTCFPVKESWYALVRSHRGAQIRLQRPASFCGKSEYKEGERMGTVV